MTILTQDKQLQGLLLVCSYCKKVRDELNLWQAAESYLVDDPADLQCSHGICPDCYLTVVKPQLELSRAQA